MWGLLERGKELAANIDKQLNESVGVEAVAAAAQPHSATHTNNNDEEDAWKDEEFDFDDEPEHPPVPPPIVAQEGWDEEVNFDDEDNEQGGGAPSPSTQEPMPVLEINSVLTRDDLMKSVISPVAETGTREENPTAHVELPLESACVSEPLLETPVESTATTVEPDALYTEVGESPVGVTSSDSEAFVEVETTDQAQVLSEGQACPSTPTPEHTITQTGLERTHDIAKSIPSMKEYVEQNQTQHSQQQQRQENGGWENDIYDDDDDDDEEDEDNNSPAAPPTSISIPSESASSSIHLQQQLQQMKQDYEDQLQGLQATLANVQSQLFAREDQLTQKAMQMAALEQQHEVQTLELRNKIKETKDEAIRRIQKAKERVATMEKAMPAKEELIAKDETIEALRQEGQKLALKQSEMEKAVRSARGETRELKHQLDEETAKHQKALDRINVLESEVKKYKDDLQAARKGESQAQKLETTLATLQEEADRKEATNLSLQQQNKELKAELKDLKKEMEVIQKGAIMESKRESNKLKKEHGDLVSEMEVKLRAAEREASVREDALRTEVTELRKRWQDAVRRADALSMDVQNSTAPLLRQLESMERQNRARAAAWAELETKLRSDLEDSVISVETLTKERNEYKSNLSRITRLSKDRDEELSSCKNIIEDQKMKLEKQANQISEMEREGKRMKEEWSEVEKMANEGVSKVRSDMMKTVLEGEERHQAQMKSIEKELKEAQSKRALLERQVEELLENAGMRVVPTPVSNSATAAVLPNSIQKKLRPSQGQADILAGALGDLEEDNEDDDETDFDNDDFDTVDGEEATPMGSFAAMEQLSQRLKESKVELEALRTSLASSERVRESLLEELSETRIAKEKLPLFEAKVQQLAIENREKEMEIMSLREDIAEIRQLYRGQLNTLLEEKAANLSESSERVRHPDVFMTPMQTPSVSPYRAQNGGASAPETPYANTQSMTGTPFDPRIVD